MSSFWENPLVTAVSLSLSFSNLPIKTWHGSGSNVPIWQLLPLHPVHRKQENLGWLCAKKQTPWQTIHTYLHTLSFSLAYSDSPQPRIKNESINHLILYTWDHTCHWLASNDMIKKGDRNVSVDIELSSLGFLEMAFSKYLWHLWK